MLLLIRGVYMTVKSTYPMNMNKLEGYIELDGC